MGELKETIKLHCSFCRSEMFVLPDKDYSPPHGTFIVCANCGRENDVTSLMLVARAKAKRIVEEHADKMVKDFAKDLKKAFMGNKHIKLR